MGSTHGWCGVGVLLAWGLLAFGPAVTVAGGAARLVKDVAPGFDPAGGSDPEGFTALGSLVLFRASDPEHGRELWRTDGTPEGTELVLDIEPGSRSSGPFGFVVLDDTAYFVASEFETGPELWRTDGTAAGTRLVADIRPGFFGSAPRELTAHDGLLFFRADDGISGEELWRSDGTEEGTQLVADVALGFFDGAPRELTSVGDILFFVADDAVHGCELWRTDGTDPGTRLVKDLRPDARCTVDVPPFGDVATGPRHLVEVQGTLFFVTEDATLWRSDGTSAGTTVVTDALVDNCPSPNAFSCPPSRLAAFGDTLLFQAYGEGSGRELWRSDGTAEGTFLLADLAPGEPGSSPQDFFVFDGAAYFTANHFLENFVVVRWLWRTDGTAEGTRPILEPPDAQLGSIAWANVDETLYFVSGSSLWRSDGTEEGTDPIIGARPSDALVAAGGNLILDRGEPWASDGTAEGARLLKDIYQLPASSTPEEGIDLDGTLLFLADGEHGSELWRSDGSAAGTVLVADILPGPVGSSAAGLTRFGDAVYFAASDGEHGPELWRSDGTTSGTRLVADILSGEEGSQPLSFHAVGATLFFTAATPERGRELWRTDGTMAGTAMVGDLNPGPASSLPSELTDLDGTLYFTASDGTGRRVWRSDGTVDGTFVISTASEPDDLASAGGLLFFSAWHPVRGREAWRSDGSAAGTFLVRDIALGGQWSSPRLFTEAGGVAVFSADDVTHGRELWRSDGTPLGTVLLRDIAPGPAGSAPNRMVSASGLAYFFANAGPTDTPLMVSDGTEAGTLRVEGLTAFHNESISTFAPIGDRLVILVVDETGELLWGSDGHHPARPIPPLDGTEAVSLAIDRGFFVAAGEMVYFVADDGIHGRELWAFPRRNLEPFCPGDCNGDGVVAIPELIAGVAIDLAAADLDECDNLDADLDETITLGELVGAVRNALDGCSGSDAG